MNLLTKIRKKQQSKIAKKESVIEEAKSLLEDMSNEQEQFIHELGLQPVSRFLEQETESLTLLQADTLTKEDIKKLCIQYRLKFLPIKHYVGPQAELVDELRKFARQRNLTTSDMKKYLYVMSPPKMLNLDKNYPVSAGNDPIFFYQETSGLFTIVTKIGKDLSMWRRFIFFPFRTFEHLVGSLAAGAALSILICILTLNSYVLPTVLLGALSFLALWLSTYFLLRWKLGFHDIDDWLAYRWYDRTYA